MRDAVADSQPDRVAPIGFADRLERWRARVREPGLTVLLVILGLAIFVLIPLNGMPIYAPRSARLPIAPIAVSLLTVAAVAMIARGRGAVIVTVIAASVGICADLVRFEWPSVVTTSVFLFVAPLFLLLLTGVVGHVVFGPGRVTAHRIQGALVVYLILALVFAFLYAIVLFFVPGAFGDALVTTDPAIGGKLLYFSLTTLTSVGYGDIVPVDPVARSLANLEAIIGQLYPATLLARVVTLQIAGRSEGGDR